MTYFGFLTIQNEDWPQGVVVLIAAGIVLRVAVWLIGKFESEQESGFPPEAKRCQVCGGRILRVLGEWVHDGDAHLVIRAMPHVPEPLTEAPR